MNAEEIAHALGGKRSGNQWKCRCPAHPDKRPSMIVFDGRDRVQLRCYAGCEPLDIITALRARGLWERWRSSRRSEDNHEATRAADKARADQVRNKMLALQLWEQAVDPRGTPVEKYLERRGLVLPPSAAVSVIRYLEKCPRRGDFAPALVALMRNVVTFEPTAIQRIYIRPDFTKDKCEVSPNGGLTLGSPGIAAMMITSRHDTFWDDLSYCPKLHICEGLETGLSLQNQGHFPVWAFGSANILEKIPVLFAVGELIICADHDERGLDAARKAKARWDAATHQIATIWAPQQAGSDYADTVVDHEEKT